MSLWHHLGNFGPIFFREFIQAHWRVFYHKRHFIRFNSRLWLRHTKNLLLNHPHVDRMFWLVVLLQIKCAWASMIEVMARYSPSGSGKAASDRHTATTFLWCFVKYANFIPEQNSNLSKSSVCQFSLSVDNCPYRGSLSPKAYKLLCNPLQTDRHQWLLVIHLDRSIMCWFALTCFTLSDRFQFKGFLIFDFVQVWQ